MQSVIKGFIFLVFLTNYFNLSVAYARDVDIDVALAKATNGDIAAMNRVGELTRMGLYHDKKFKQALTWFEKAAASGSSDAIVNIGKMHSEGYGFKKDKKMAFSYYQKAAKLKNTKAMYELSSAYRSGEGVEKNEIKGMEILKECSALGDTNCTMLLNFLNR